MTAGNAFLQSKLYDMQREFQALQRCMSLYSTADHERIRSAIQKLTAEWSNNEAEMSKMAETGRSPAVNALSGEQLRHSRSLNAILKNKLPTFLHCSGSTEAEDKAEAANLYAEYAIDNAIQNMRHAMLATLKAIDSRLNCEETAALGKINSDDKEG